MNNRILSSICHGKLRNAEFHWILSRLIIRAKARWCLLKCVHSFITSLSLPLSDHHHFMWWKIIIDSELVPILNPLLLHSSRIHSSHRIQSYLYKILIIMYNSSTNILSMTSAHTTHFGLWVSAWQALTIPQAPVRPCPIFLPVQHHTGLPVLECNTFFPILGDFEHNGPWNRSTTTLHLVGSFLSLVPFKMSVSLRGLFLHVIFLPH